MSNKIAYLVRTPTGIQVTFKKPPGVTLLKKGGWIFRTSQRELGSSNDYLYCNGWIGPIGVYDTSNPRHVVAMVEMVISHEKEIIAHHLQIQIHSVFGKETEKNVCRYEAQQAMDRRKRILPKRPLDKVSRLFLETIGTVRGGCR